MLGGIGAFAALVLFIVAHEAGHYFAAKATGMKVTEFFLGFGPRIWSFKRGETEYGIKPIPFGAYVKVVGMSALEDVPPEDLDRTYRIKPFWAKSLVVLSGVAANFLIAWLIFVGIAFSEGAVVIEDGEPVYTPVISTVIAEYEGETTAAAAAGIQPGDRIVAIDGRRITEWGELQSELSTRPNESVEVVVLRDGAELELPLTMGSRPDPDTGEIVGFLGVSPQLAIRSVGFFEAAGQAGQQVGRGVVFTFESFGRLLRLDTLTQLAGGVVGGEVDNEVRPVSLVGIVQIGAQADEFGLTNFLFLLGIVNVILGTLNALPLYPLDGGHFAVALYEKVTRREADVRKLIPVAVTVVGIISIIGILAIILDIVNPIDL